MKRFLALSTLAVVTAGAAGSAMARGNEVAISVGIPGPVYVNAQSTHHAQSNQHNVHRVPVAQPRLHGADSRHLHARAHAPAYTQYSPQQYEQHAWREQRHGDQGHGRHERRRVHHDY